MKFKVAVIGGAGHIGLPMSCFIQNKGIETLIIDKNEEALDLIKHSIPPFREKDFKKIYKLQIQMASSFQLTFQTFNTVI